MYHTVTYSVNDFDITDRLRLLNSRVTCFTIKTESDVPVNFTYFPSHVTSLTLVDTVLSDDAAKTLKTSNVFIYGVDHYELESIYLPETGVPLLYIRIKTNQNLLNVDVPPCKYMQLRSDYIGLEGCRLGEDTAIDCSNFSLIDCDGMINLDAIYYIGNSPIIGGSYFPKTIDLYQITDDELIAEAA